MINEKCFILNPKDWVLDKESELYVPFWKEQKYNCIHGVTAGGVHMPGRLYFHINFGTIEIDIQQGSKSYKQKGKPYFRDIDWEIFNKLEEAELSGKGVILFTGRGAGKSFIAASVLSHTYSFFDDSECVVSSEDTKHIKALMSKTDLCLNNVPFPFFKHRITDNLSEAIWAGWKDKKTGQRMGSRSHILVRNYKNNSMAANGTRPKFHVFEEIGTMQNIKSDYNDSVSCWRNDMGQFGIPFLIGTGGDMDKGAGAAEMFNEPEQYNLISITDEWESGKQIGLFIPATKAKNQIVDEEGNIVVIKKPKPISTFLNIPNPEEILLKTNILVSDEALAKKYFDVERNKKKKASDPMTYLKEVMYNPFVPSEVLIRSGGRWFNPETLNGQITHLEAHFPDLGLPVELYINPMSGKVESRGTDKKPIKEFPVRTGTSKEGCIVLYEPPIDNPPYGLYVAGIDPYDQNNSETSSSLGSCFIYKMFSGFKDEEVVDKDKIIASRQIVAEYTGRPELAQMFYENCRMLLMYYNAIALVENENIGIITYFYNRHCDYMLADTPELVRNILPNSTSTRSKGVQADPNNKIRKYALGLARDYLTEDVYKEFDADGKLLKVYPGVARVKSIPLLKELIAYNDEDAKGNYDRVVAFLMCLLYEEETQTKITSPDAEDHDPVSFFADIKNIFNKRRVESW